MGAAQKLVDKEIFRSLVPLNALSDTHFNELIKKAKIEELSSGYYLFKKGDRDNQTVYLLDGEVALLQGRKEQSLVFSGSEEALHPLSAQQPRQFTARTKGRTTVMRIDSGLLDVMLTWDQSTSSCYEVNDLQSDEDEDWMTRMLQSELMHKLPAHNLQQLIMRMEELEAKSGDTVVQQDEKGDFYYIIKQGTCVVARKLSVRGKPIKLAELNEGDSFGEEALLSGGKRNASIIMKTDGVLMRLAKKDFDELLKDPLVTQVTYKEGCEIVEDTGVWLDVRLPGEYKNGHIPGSLNIPLAAIRDDTDKLDTAVKYIVYCDTGRRSSSAIFLLGQDGFDGCILKDGLASVPHNELEISTETDSAISHLSGVPNENVEVIPFSQAKSKKDSRIKDQVSANNLKVSNDNQQKMIKIMQDQLDTLQHELVKKEEELSELRADKGRNSEYHTEVEKLKGELKDTLDKASDLERQLEDNKSHSVTFKDEVSTLTSRLDSEAQEHQATIEKLSETEVLMQQYKQEGVEFQLHVKQIQDEIVTLETKVQEEDSIRKALEEKIEGLRVDRDYLVQEKKNQITNLEQKLSELQENLEEQLQAREQAEQQFQSIEQESSKHLVALRLAEKEITHLKTDQEKYSSNQQSVEAERIERVRLEEKLENLEKEFNQKLEDLALAEKEITQLQSEQEKYSSNQESAEVERIERVRLEEKLANLEKEFNQKLEELTLAEKEITQLQSDQEKYSSNQESAEVERIERVRLEEQLSILEQEINQNRNELESSKEESANLRIQLEETSALRKTLDEENKARDATEQKLASVEKEFTTVQKALEKAEADRTIIESRLDELSGIQENLKSEQEERKLLEQKLDSLDWEFVKAQKALELANEEITHFESKLESSSGIHKTLDEECAARHKIEQQLESIEKEFIDAQKALEEADAERTIIESKLGELVCVQENLETEQEERKLLEDKLESLDWEFVKAQKALELANEEITHFESKLKSSSEIQEQLDKERDARQKIEGELEGFKQDFAQNEDILEKTTKELSKLQEELEKSGQDESSSIATLKDENKALLSQVEKVSKEGDKVNREYKNALESWQSKEHDLEVLKRDTEKLTQQLDEMTLSKENLEEQLSGIEEQKNRSDEEEGAAQRQAEDDINRLEQELKDMRDKEKQYKNNGKELEEELKKLTADLERARARSDDLDNEMEQFKNSVLTKKEMDDESSQSKEIIEGTKALREEMEELKRSMVEPQEKDDAIESPKDLGLQDDPLKDEVEILRKELEKIYRDQEVAIETGRPPTPLKPLNIPDLLGNKIEADDSSISSLTAEKDSLKDSVSKDDPFEIADLDQQLFQAEDYVSKGGRRWVVLSILAILCILGMIGVYWYFLKPTAENGLTPSGFNEVIDRKPDSVVQETAIPVRKKVSRIVEEKITTRKKAVINNPIRESKKSISSKADIKPRSEIKLMSAGKTYKDTLRTGSSGPVMVKVGKGEFEMGSASSSTYFDERPKHTVTLKAFSISKYEITFDDYERYAEAESLAMPDDHGWGRGKRPVINVSWNDAVGYAKWLSDQTGYHYRLPTEAEWEYTARAGTETLYWWGTLIEENIANCFNCGSQWDGQGTAPVGSFRANALGLHDVTGNVMEWTQDCHHENYTGAPVNGKAWHTANCASKVVRGGSYRTTSVNLRTSKREHLAPEIYADNVGFRLVRE